MFFFFPLGFGGGGILGILIFYWIVRLIFRLFFGGSSSRTYYRFDSQDSYNSYRQYRSANEFSNANKDWYSVLGVSAQSSNDEVKKAYRSLILKYHPDRQANADDKQKEESTKRFREVQEAYENICKMRNM